MMSKYICKSCGEEFDYDNALFECEPDMCEHCKQEQIRDDFGYDGDCLF